MNPLKKLYYQATAAVPRKLPHTDEAYQSFRKVLIEAYGVPNIPQAWLAVAGQITSTPAHQLRKPWGHIANAGKRIEINATAQRSKLVIAADLEARLKRAAEDFAQQEKENEQASEVQPQANDEPKPQEDQTIGSQEAPAQAPQGVRIGH